MLQGDNNIQNISEEVRRLVSNIDKLVSKKDEISENFKKKLLSSSNNN